MDSDLLAEEAEKANEAAKEQDRKLSRLVYVYREVFKTEAGREVIMDLLNQCHVFQSTMTGNSYTYYNEGMRKVGLYVLGMLDIPEFEPINMNRKKN